MGKTHSLGPELGLSCSSCPDMHPIFSLLPQLWLKNEPGCFTHTVTVHVCLSDVSAHMSSRNHSSISAVTCITLMESKLPCALSCPPGTVQHLTVRVISPWGCVTSHSKQINHTTSHLNLFSLRSDANPGPSTSAPSFLTFLPTAAPHLAEATRSQRGLWAALDCFSASTVETKSTRIFAECTFASHENICGCAELISVLAYLRREAWCRKHLHHVLPHQHRRFCRPIGLLFMCWNTRRRRFNGIVCWDLLNCDSNVLSEEVIW